MAIQAIQLILMNGVPDIITNNVWSAVKLLVGIAVLVLVKLFCSGSTNTSERNMHSKVVMITGGTTGIGAATALELARRGAQIILLTHLPPSDPFLVDQIEDLREQSANELVYAEQCDLSSLHSIRQFATRWIDNAPPRRLDMVVLCASTLTPPGRPRAVTAPEGVEENWMVNYLANFHLLSILSPAIRAQPPDRDVRILVGTCGGYVGAEPGTDGGVEAAMKGEGEGWRTGRAYRGSKFAVMVFALAFQKHLDAYKRPDGAPANARVVIVDPGLCRTVGMRRWLTRGSLTGLGVYLLMWQAIWLLLKSPGRGAQSFLYAAMEESFGRGHGGRMVKECREVRFGREDVKDETIAKKLWEGSEKLIERVEREEAMRRALEKKGDVTENGGAKADEASSTKETSTAKKAKSRRARKAA